ncbi:hypothetical protein BS47DRAFT_1366462 [Hydnum rufescens UP504]|uniref:NADH:ubiquinone oxidoreductase intermediate-associated protein 30 domain-containing protein n=1 Tax=Hydnum rufescens UP504 TaxID=1448309 RepID=A0A9P6DQT0_9AGAM|nr:hypothetical protein BS47DRAFT_1366462 [Hydnum rufescens UP504]
MRSGYAGFRNRVRTTLFGNITDDLTLHNYLALRVRPAGDPRTRTAYFVNIQTDGPIPTDLWQHRLYLPENSSGNTWESVIIPLESFVLTNAGETASEQLSMMRSRIRGNAKVAGAYELGIDYIGAIEYMQDAEALDRLVNKPEETKVSPQ